MVTYRMLADFIVILHASYVAFVGLGLLAIVLGLIFRKSWARNFWFRMLHLAAIAFVVVEEAARIPCPLTVWENQYRKLAGQTSYPGAFVGYWAHQLIFFDLSPRFFTVFYVMIGLTVLAIFILGPPRWPFAQVDSAESTNSA